MSKNEAALRLAREIAAKDADERDAPEAAILIREGSADHFHGVQIALAAILEVTERAAKYVYGKDVWDMIKNNDADTSWHQSQIATALRNLEHLS